MIDKDAIQQKSHANFIRDYFSLGSVVRVPVYFHNRALIGEIQWFGDLYYLLPRQ